MIFLISIAQTHSFVLMTPIYGRPTANKRERDSLCSPDDYILEYKVKRNK